MEVDKEPKKRPPPQKKQTSAQQKKAKTTTTEQQKKSTKRKYENFEKFRIRPRQADLENTIKPAQDDVIFYLTGSDYSYQKGHGVSVNLHGNLADTSTPFYAQVYGFNAHFWISKPEEWATAQCDHFVRKLDAALRTSIQSSSQKNYELLNALEDEINPSLIKGYSISKEGEFDGCTGREFIEVMELTVVHPKMVRILRELIESPEGKVGAGYNGTDKLPNWCPEEMLEDVYKMKVYEADVDFLIRFFVDTQLKPCTWYKVPKGKYKVIKSDDWARKTTNDLEISTWVHSLEMLTPKNKEKLSPEELKKFDPKWETMLPNLTVAVIDTEWETTGKRFPSGHIDPILQISVVVFELTTDVVRSYIFALKSIKPFDTADAVFWFDTEEEMLVTWRLFMKVLDPDIWSHHNGNKFDIPEILNRAKALGLDKDYDILGRMKRKGVYIAKTTNKGFEKWNVSIPALINCDVYRMYSTDSRLQRHNLDAMCAAYLEDGMTKEEIDYELISHYQKTEDGRTRMAIYCVRDSYLVYRIIKKKKTVENILGMGKRARINPQTRLDRSTGALLETQIRYLAHHSRKRKKLKISKNKSDRGRAKPPPVSLKKETNIQSDADDLFVDTNKLIQEELAKQDGYDGATVLKPIKGYYHDVFVITLDFAGMYPSIIMAWNLCWTTYVPDEVIDKLGLKASWYDENDVYHEEDYYRKHDVQFIDGKIVHVPNPNNPAFLTPKREKGILPELEKALKAERGAIKKQMANLEKRIEELKNRIEKLIAEDGDKQLIKDLQFEHSQLNIAQEIIKIIMNSAYGVGGDPTSIFYKKEIAATVTGTGTILSP